MSKNARHKSTATVTAPNYAAWWDVAYDAMLTQQMHHTSLSYLRIGGSIVICMLGQEEIGHSKFNTKGKILLLSLKSADLSCNKVK